MNEDTAGHSQFSRLMELTDEFCRELLAATQAMEAARPILQNGELCGWFEAEINLRPGLVLCRQGSVAATMALMRIWAPSGDSFSIQKLTAEANRCGRASPRFSDLSAAMKRSPQFCKALDRLTRWRSKRIAHRESNYIINSSKTGDMATLIDFDLVVDQLINIFDTMQVVFPSITFPNARLNQNTFSNSAWKFWSEALKSYPEPFSLFERGRFCARETNPTIKP